jgi:hypothetical protein
LRQHSKIAVQGLDRMHKQRGSSGGAQRSGDLTRDDPTLSHARDYNAAGTGVQQFHGSVEILSHGSGNAVGEVSQGLGLDADDVFAGSVHEGSG